MRKLVALAVIVVAAAAWAWWRYAPDSLPGFVAEHVVRSPEANPPLYKWRDADGQWQVTDRPPTDRPYEEVRVDPRQNVVPTVVPGRTEPPKAGG